VYEECFGTCVCGQTAGVLWCRPGCPCHGTDEDQRRLRLTPVAELLAFMTFALSAAALQPARARP
jgi:hypothetical protein